MRREAGVWVAAILVGACGGEEPYDGLLRPPPAADGMQLALKIPVEPGQELTVCKNFAIPSGTFDIGRFEHAMNDSSHHLLVFPILLASTLVTDEVFYDCDENEDAQGDRIGFMYGSQSATGEVALPKGYAYGAMGGIAVQIEFHIFNASDEPLDAEAVVNLWRTREEIIGDAGTLFAFNNRIVLPPMSTGSARQRCPIVEDLKLMNLTPHMHSRGTAMQILVDRGDGAPEVIVDAQGWDEDTVQFDPPIDIAAGDVIDIRCQYNNPSSVYVHDGSSARNDEMCVTGGIYYRTGARLPIQDEVCVNEGIVYTGTQSCSQVESCIRTLDFSRPVLPQYEICVVAGCQTGVDQFMRADSCRWEMCNAECYINANQDGEVDGIAFDSTACASCIDTKCAAHFAGCASTCQ